MTQETVFILLFVVATAVAIAAQRLRIPYTVGLVAAGLGLGMVHALPAPHLTKELLFSVFLPGLLFEAAYHVEFRELWRNRWAITSLAFPGVVAATALTAVILARATNSLHVVPGFDWRHALVFGALISATDPVAVVALFRTLGVPRRLTLLLEGESLLNDGTGIVFFTLSLAVAGGGSVAPLGLALDFARIVGVGLVIGTGTGLAASHVIQRVDEPMIEITVTTVAAYVSFLVAEHFHYSGVIAAVATGMFCGNYGARTGMSPSTRVAVETFWEYVAFALNSVVFLLIGFEIDPHTLVASWPVILVAYLAVTVGRGTVIALASAVLAPTRERIPRPWTAILFWGGLRGGLPMVLVLSLPAEFPHRELLVHMTFGVVLLSILVHGLTMAPVLRWLGVVANRDERDTYELLRGRVQTAQAALEELSEMPRGHLTEEGLLRDLRDDYGRRIRAAREEIRQLELDPGEIRTEEVRWARRHLLLVERERAVDAFRQGTLSRRAYERLLADVDARLLELETEVAPPRERDGPDPDEGHT